MSEKENIMSGIAHGLNSVATPASLTTKVIGAIMGSAYTKETIRALILDPVTRKTIPSIKVRGISECRTLLIAIYQIMPANLLKKFDKELKLEDRMKELDKYISDGDSFRFFYDLFGKVMDAQVHTEIIRYKQTIIYFQYIFDDNKYIFNTNIYFVGPGAKALYEKIQKMREQVEWELGDGMREKNKNKVKVYTLNDGPRPSIGYATVPSTIVIDPIETQLKACMDMVKKSENVSEEFSINKTTGLLLYGPPGTGKSTIVRWLAMELGRAIILVDADGLFDAVNFVKQRPKTKFIMLIEDIDFKFVDRRTQKKDDKNNEMMKQTDILFQILDGVLSENNLMVVATTNYIERLDPALIRDSRFDFQIEVLGFSYEDAVKVCEKFHITPDEIKLKEWTTPITPASLQTFILKYKVSGEGEVVKNE